VVEGRDRLKECLRALALNLKWKRNLGLRSGRVIPLAVDLFGVGLNLICHLVSPDLIERPYTR